MVGWPLYRLGQNLNKRGRLPDMKMVCAAITAAVAAGILFVFFFVPMPISRVRETGIVQVQPAHIRKCPSSFRAAWKRCRSMRANTSRRAIC